MLFMSILTVCYFLTSTYYYFTFYFYTTTLFYYYSSLFFFDCFTYYFSIFYFYLSFSSFISSFFEVFYVLENRFDIFEPIFPKNDPKEFYFLYDFAYSNCIEDDWSYSYAFIDFTDLKHCTFDIIASRV